MLTGYLHQAYAESLAEFGNPRQLPECGGWILERSIPGFDDIDAMGCYPLFACDDWTRLHYDMETLEKRLVSLAVVADPFGNFTVKSLRNDFDILIPFKQHYVCDLTLSLDTVVSKHHLRNVRKALDTLQIEWCQEPTSCTNEWYDLYSHLIKRHAITGIPAFSKQSLEKQLRVPGLVIFRAVYEGQCVGMILWYMQKDVSYYHLAAYSDLGYRLRASFGLFWRSFEHFASLQIKWLNLGGSPGIQEAEGDQLSRFKQGWSSGTKTTYFCGRIFDQERYRHLVKAKGIPAIDYFPAYRKGEFSNASAT